MISFIVCLALLITGYLTYGKIVDNTFGPDDRETPAVRINDGASIAEVTGKYLGHTMQNVMRVFSVVLLIMVGTVFAVGPAGLIVTLCKNSRGSGDLHERGFLHVLHPCAGMPRQPAEQQDGRRRGYLQHRSRIPHRHCIRSNLARCVHSRDQKAWHEEKRINDRIRCSRPFVLFDRLQSSAEVIEVTENVVETVSTERSKA